MPSTATRPERVSSRTGPQTISLEACPVDRRRSGADARQKLLHVEGLRHVVVGAGVEALDLVAPAVAGRQDDHRRLDARAPPAVEHGDAVDLRQAEIEDDRVIGLGLAEEAAVLAVESLVDRVARMLEGGDDLAVEVPVVLDDE